ncbi:biotin--[acetyl-CoA-carboxylase] ligase [Ostreiculturibacter nitratireducens]|uniref:biotin--[acetyl-CoA-carboxylase] ligase n=1 Tax=Ostreiculturibacter nitratireducens TaxID=3075226 RepID=UPI0031B5AE15
MSAEAAAPSWAWPEGVERHVLDEVDSTNAEAQRRAPGLTGPAWILARRQTAARGRRGRAWASPEGNFAATLVLRPKGTPAEAALLSFVAALALHEALSTLTGRPEALSLKWPNDVLLNGGKVSGILLESLGSGVSIAHLAIGIGVNLAAAPDAAALEAGAMRPVSVRGETGISVLPEEFLDFLAAAFARHQQQFETYGFSPIRTAWLGRAARLGERITARTGSETIEGIFDSLDPTGALVLATSQGRRVIPAADVFF